MVDNETSIMLHKRYAALADSVVKTYRVAIAEKMRADGVDGSTLTRNLVRVAQAHADTRGLSREVRYRAMDLACITFSEFAR
jgi:hypothetical protein